MIEKYAAPAQMGAIHGQTDRNGLYWHEWLVEGNEIRYNASEEVAPPGLDRLVVTENLIVQADGHSGLIDTTSTPGYFDRATIEWDNNTYQLGTADRVFTYGTELLSTAQWLAKGHDLNSTFR